MFRRVPRSFVSTFGVVLLVISFTTCATTGGSPSASFTEALSDASEDLRAAPEPLWRLPVLASEITNARLLGDGAIALTTARPFGFMQSWGLMNATMVVGDVNTGDLLWRSELNDLSGSVEEILDGGDVTFLNGVDYSVNMRRLSAATVVSGDVIWTQLFPQTFVFLYDEAQRRIFGAGKTEGDGFRVVSLDATSGVVSWERELSANVAWTGPRSCSLYNVDGSVLVVGRSVSLFDGATGETLWSVNLDPSLTETPASSLAGYALLLNSNGRLALIDVGAGQERWVHGTPGIDIVAQVVAGNRIFLVIEDADQGSALSAINVDSGGLAWTTKLPGSLRSGLYVYDGTVYLTVSDAMLTFDAVTGAAGETATLPEFMRSDYGLPDQLRQVEERLLLVAREMGVVAFDAETLEVAYAHGIEGTEVYTFHVASQRLLMRQLARSGGSAGFDSVGLTRELQRQVIRNNTGSEPEFAQGVPRTANESQAEATMAAASMASSIAAAGIAFREEAVANNMRISELEIVAALSAHRLSLQDAYYVRPFQRGDWGFSVVRLGDGARADLYVSRAYEPLLINSGNFPIFFVDADGRRLIVNGIGREFYPDETFTKVGFGKDVFKVWPGIPPNWTVPNVSVFAYDLDSLGFRPADSFQQPSARPRIGALEERLRDAILGRDRGEVQRLIDEGADVNAVDEAGFNSLFYAAMIDDKRIAQALIDAGGNATLRDPHGRLAYHYTFFTHGDNRSTQVFRGANLAQLREAEN